MTHVAGYFSGTYHVSTFLWDTITTKQVHEYSEGDMGDGFIVNETKNPRTGILCLVSEIQDSVWNVCELQTRQSGIQKNRHMRKTG